MPNYTFQEILTYFGEKVHSTPSPDDIEKGETELVIDNLNIILSQGKSEGSLYMRVMLGLLLQPIREERLKELACSNFLGINTGGCTLSLDEAAVALSLHCHTTSGATPQENWEWLHRLLCVAREWHTLLTLWDEFVSLAATEQKEAESTQGGLGKYKV